VDHAAHARNHQRVPARVDSEPDAVLQKIGMAIRALRIAQGISQERLALLAEVDRSYVGRIERGENNIAVLTLVRIASALSMTVAELMARAGL
jgi:transcriptional regulator with XRE-family HTH domain